MLSFQDAPPACEKNSETDPTLAEIAASLQKKGGEMRCVEIVYMYDYD